MAVQSWQSLTRERERDVEPDMLEEAYLLLLSALHDTKTERRQGTVVDISKGEGLSVIGSPQK